MSSSFAHYDDLVRSPASTLTPLTSNGAGGGVDEDEEEGARIVLVSNPALSGQPKQEDDAGAGAAGEGEGKGDDGTIKICHIPALLAYTKTTKKTLPRGAMEDDLTEVATTEQIEALPGAYDASAGILLAVHHFNHGIGSIVKELEGIDTRCDVRLMSSMFDIRSDDGVAVRTAHELLLLGSGSEGDNKDDQLPSLPMCALVGPMHPSRAAKIATTTGALSVPQISPLASLSSLSDKRQYPLFGRPYPSVSGTAAMAVRYFADVLGSTHMAALVPDCPYGVDYGKAIEVAAAELGVNVVVSPMPAHPPDDASIERALTKIQDGMRRHVFAVVFDMEYDMIMTVAERMGMAGAESDHLWVFADFMANMFLDGNRTYETGSGLASATHGIGVLRAKPLAGDEGGGYDRFLEAWKGLADQPEAVAYINARQPAPPRGSPAGLDFNETADFFADRTPNAAAPLSYDAVVGLGLAACRADADAEAKAATENDGQEEAGAAVFTGEAHFDSYVAQTFEGATGMVAIDEATSTRDPTTFTYVVSNVVGSPTVSSEVKVDDDGGTSSMSTTFTGHPAVKFEAYSGKWAPVTTQDATGSYKSVVRFVYSDDTTSPPLQLPPTNEEMNYISTPVLVLGLVMAAIAMVLPLLFGAWTVKHRTSHAVRASQPEFLFLVAAGCVVLASTIIPLSVDDSWASADGCSMACVAAPWLACMSFSLIFSALFSKTWRVIKLFKNPLKKRVKVTARDVSAPLVAILLSNVLVLSLWTALSPLHWVRESVAEDILGRTVASVGACASEQWTIYAPLLCVINGGALLIAIYQAYAARDIQTDFCESKYIFFICCSLLQALVFGVPLLVIVSYEPSASFFIQAAIITTLCLVVSALIFVPKILLANEMSGGGGATRRASSSSRRGSNLSNSLRRASMNSNNRRGSMESTGSGSNSGSVHVSGLSFSSKDAEIQELMRQLIEVQGQNVKLVKQLNEDHMPLQLQSGGTTTAAFSTADGDSKATRTKSISFADDIMFDEEE